VTRLGGIGAIAAVAALLAFGATAASAATWAGETHGKLYRANRLASGGSSWHGSFWFRTDRHGRVHGEAVVAYEPTLDLSGASNALSYIRGQAGAALSLLGPWGAAASNAGLSQIVGFGTSFQSAEAIRRGPLTGQLSGGRLTLDWKKVKGVRYSVELVMAAGNNAKVSSGTAGLPTPFKGSGRVLSGQFAVRSAESRSSKGGTSERKGSYWAAHRVG
jgi:hypothetical protein